MNPFLLQHLGENMNLDTDADWTQILDNQPIVLNDRMMTDAVQSPHIQSEHSYSLTLNDELNPQSPFGHNIKLEDYGKGRIIFFLNQNIKRYLILYQVAFNISFYIDDNFCLLHIHLQI